MCSYSAPFPNHVACVRAGTWQSFLHCHACLCHESVCHAWWLQRHPALQMIDGGQNHCPIKA